MLMFRYSNEAFSVFQDLLSLQEPGVKGFSDNKVALRILCKFKAPGNLGSFCLNGHLLLI